MNDIGKDKHSAQSNNIDDFSVKFLGPATRLGVFVISSI